MSKNSNPLDARGRNIAVLCLLLILFLTVQEAWHRHATSTSVRQAELCLTCVVGHTADTVRTASPVPLVQVEFLPLVTAESSLGSLLAVFALYIRPPPVQ